MPNLVVGYTEPRGGKLKKWRIVSLKRIDPGFHKCLDWVFLRKEVLWVVFR